MSNASAGSLPTGAPVGLTSDAAATVTTSVTFWAPFMLPGLDRPHPPGTFELQETRQRLDVSWEAYHVSLSILLVNGGTTQLLDIARDDLHRALAEDAAAATHRQP